MITMNFGITRSASRIFALAESRQAIRTVRDSTILQLPSSTGQSPAESLKPENHNISSFSRSARRISSERTNDVRNCVGLAVANDE